MVDELARKFKNIPIVRKLIMIDRKLSNGLEYKVRYNHKLAWFFILFKQIVDIIGFPLMGLILFFSAPKGLLLTIAWLFMAGINELGLKFIFKRSRPFMIDGDWSENSHLFGYSFPSNHAYVAGFFIVVWVTLHLPYMKVMVAIFTLLPISRIVLNYHFVSDVFTGFIIGVVWAELILKLLGLS